SEEVELQLQILPIKNQILEATTTKSNSLIFKMKTLSDSLATMYSNTSN
ncbi:21206_t:CDS:1, partial [Dentiscutata erythropus]